MTKTGSDRKTIAPTDYAALQSFLQEHCGIVLGAGKEYLASSRLNWLLRETGAATVGELLGRVARGADQKLFSAIIDAMTTNETFWFRDQGHYRMLTEEILPAATGRIRIWSAACSSGQEPYTIGMVVHDYLASKRGHAVAGVEILGTDISTRMLAEAKGAVYCGISSSRGLTPEQRNRYFVAKEECIEVRPEIRRLVNFRQHNLTRGYETLGRFDVIFCRNVLIYFSSDQKADIIQRLANALKPGGYLFLGSTESLLAHSDLFEMVSRGGGIGYRLRTS